MNRPTRLLAQLERGRRPYAVALVTTGALAGLSPIRFVVLVGRMTPEAYGYLSIFNTLTSLLPYALTLGLPLQFLHFAGRSGRSSIPVLRRIGIGVVLVCSVPAALVCFVLVRPFAEADTVGSLTVMSVITSACVAWAILISQTLLGLRARAASVLAMFGYNSLLTATVLVLAIWQGVEITVPAVMLAWTVASIVGLVWAIALLGFAPGAPMPPDPGTPVEAPSVFAGLPVLPALLGPWLLLMLVRYSLGITSGGQALATFALSWTLVDLAFLLAVNLPSLASTDVMLERRSTWPVFGGSAVLLVLLLAMGIVALEVVIAWVAPTYKFSIITTVLVALGAISRLAVATWLPRSVGRGQEGRVSLVYMAAAGGLALILVSARPSSPEANAFALSAAFTFVAILQILLTRPKLPTGVESAATL